ncbi:hypothetical protein ACFQFC_32180 [Amorphoplanes digitatis]|uniref:Uncharacterized protein n=1 Tax=Actinoplanes digitatis TaxID=1868 RepID=A0A7W7HU11_9ACTN|nr:hypothetical protein [Actinoplanes digitatis]MBB4760813.1 hypothetical protein [Actinoplanes digitatis]GID98630.1 hypothetical protein Adi01nite_80420 [Actinoplanes digitatis]
MKSTVDVWVAATAAAALTPPPRSIVDGASAAVIVRTCVLGRPLQRRIEISLTVDPATADRFSRACRRQMIWKRWVLPIGIVAAVALGVADLVLDSWMPPHVTSLVTLTVIVAAALGRQRMASLSSPHHPRRLGRDTVLIRGVDRETAHFWVGLNSPQAICIAD